MNDAPSPFSAREAEILDAMAGGLGCRDIGLALGISEFTVRKHRSHMFAKSGTQSAAQLVALARRRGWLKTVPGPPAAGPLTA